MTRALSLVPCESFSPALLRSEPAALAAWIRFRLAKWLINAPMKKSGWHYPSTMHFSSETIQVGRDAAKFEVQQGDETPIEIQYNFPGTGFELGARIPFTMMQTLASPKASNELWILHDVTGDGNKDSLENLGFGKRCLLIDLRTLLDAEVTQRGQGLAGCAMLLGVQPQMQADFSKLAAYSRRLLTLAGSPITRQTAYVPGLRGEWNPTNVMSVGGVDTRAIYEDVEIIFSHHDFRACLFFGGVQGTSNPGSVAFMGSILNPVPEDRGALPKAVKTIGKTLLDNLAGGKGPKALEQSLLGDARKFITDKIPDANVRKAIAFGLGEVGKSKKEIEADLIGKGKELIDSKLPDGFGKKAFDFAVDHIGKSKAEIEKDLIHDVAGSFKGKIDAKLPDGFMKKVVDFGIDHAGESGKELKDSARHALQDEAKALGQAYWDAHKDQLLQYKYPAIAVAAAALASSKSLRDMAIAQVKKDLPSIEKTVLNEVGGRLGLPSGATTFIKDNADAIVKGDWQGVAKAAITNELGGSGFASQAASIILEKATGQPVTSTAVKILGAQGLKLLFDDAPVVASGKAGEAAVTGVTASHVTVQGPAGIAQQLSHGNFAAAYDTVASTGLF